MSIRKPPARRRGLVLSASLLMLMFGYSNCHPGVQGSSSPVQQSSLDPNAEEASHPVSKFEREAGPKVALDPRRLSPGSGGSVQGKATTGSDDFTIPRGMRLAIVVDNQCLRTRAKARASGQLKPTAPALAEKAQSIAQAPALPEMKIQAYGFVNPSDASYSEIMGEAENDPCVLRVAHDDAIQLINPSPERTATEPFTEPFQKATLNMATNDPALSYQRHLASIKATSGWSVFHSPSRGIRRDVVVAVVDSGIDSAHPDLAANMWRDGQGRFGYDFSNNDSDPTDDDGHGTHVAGLIGAVADNSTGGVGIMGKRIKLMGMKVLDAQGAGTPSTVANAIRWAADSGADVINLSLEGPATSDTGGVIASAMQYAAGKNVVIVAAAGNKQLNLSTLTPANAIIPATYTVNIPGSIAVASIDAITGMRSPFSNFSNQIIPIAAPGSDGTPGSNGLWSTWPTVLRGVSTAGYVEQAGTSMAAPLVSGSAALTIGILRSENIPITNAQVIQLLLQSAVKNPALATEVIGGATVDVDRLARLIRSRYLMDGDAGTEAP